MAAKRPVRNVTMRIFPVDGAMRVDPSAYLKHDCLISEKLRAACEEPEPTPKLKFIGRGVQPKRVGQEYVINATPKRADNNPAILRSLIKAWDSGRAGQALKGHKTSAEDKSQLELKIAGIGVAILVAVLGVWLFASKTFDLPDLPEPTPRHIIIEEAADGSAGPN